MVAPTRGRVLRIFEILVWALAPAVVMYNSGDLIGRILVAFYGAPESIPPAVVSRLIFVSPVFPLLLGVAAIVRLKIGGHRIRSVLGFSKANLAADARFGFVVGLLAMAIGCLSLSIVGRFLPLPPFHLMPPHVHLFFMTVGAVAPGFGEELYYRGMLIRIATRWRPVLIALLSAVGFSLWHIATPAYLPHTFVMGVLMAWLVLRTGRIAPAIIAHTVANVLVGVLFLSGWVPAGD